MEQKSPLVEEIEKILGKIVYITLDDKRKIIGKLVCIDQQMNIAISEAAEELLINDIPTINEKLKFFRRKEVDINEYIPNKQFDENAQEDFRKNKYYAGSVILPGKHIIKIEIAADNL